MTSKSLLLALSRLMAAPCLGLLRFSPPVKVGVIAEPGYCYDFRAELLARALRAGAICATEDGDQVTLDGGASWRPRAPYPNCSAAAVGGAAGHHPPHCNAQGQTDIRSSGGSLEPPGPLHMRLHTV